MSRGLKTRLALLIVLLIILGISSWTLVRESNGKLTVAFLNIGQGDSIFIESPTGNQMLIDGGPGRGVLRELSKVMPFYDRTIDIVMESHPDADHIGGLPDVLERYKVAIFMEPGVRSDTAIDKETEKDVVDEKSKFIEARRGMRIELGGGARLEILYPTLDPRGMETNTASIVARLVYGESEFLLTGDSPISIENYLISLQDAHGGDLNLQSDVLKAGHHGSRTSTAPEYVAAVKPKYAVISAGKDNKYGHPHKEVLDTLEKAGVQVLRTDQDGRIVFESDGVNLRVNKN
jgi:competence protein ComEC